MILQHLGKPETLIAFVPDRLGHDRRYAIDSTKVKTELGWKPLHQHAQGIAETIEWYLHHREWWEPLLKS
jgi:dTDP-glucose 4,6-dehydratase